MKKTLSMLIVCLCMGLFLMNIPVQAASPEDPMVLIRDLTRIDGVRDNMLSGMGLVVGLNGTGDSRFSTTFQMLKNMMDSYGIVADEASLRSKNVAAVTVTAVLPPFARSGDYLDVTIQSIGDAKSLQGGTLLLTALKAPNGQIFAAAQGAISIGGFSAGTGGNTTQQNHLQVARVPNGALIERTLEPDLSGKTEIDLLLQNWNFETATLIAQAINDHFKHDTLVAEPLNAGRVTVKVPTRYRNNIVAFISEVQSLQVRASMPAKVVINERTGTIVIGHSVRISTVAVSHGNLTVTISTQTDSAAHIDKNSVDLYGKTTVQVDVTEEKKQLLELKTGPTVSDVVKALNAIGASPRDIIAILQAMKEAGALYAQLELI